MKYKDEVIRIERICVNVKQVNKVLARRLYNEGKTIFLNACNMRINNMWTTPCPISKGNEAWSGDSFDGRVNEYQWYNCDNERGKYANYFVEV